MINKPDNVVAINTSLDGLFKSWFLFLKPIHGLTDREIDVAANLVKQRYLLSKTILDDAILDKVVMSSDIQSKVRQECDITLPHFRVILGSLRKSNIIKEDKINPLFIPRLKEDSNLQLMILFKINK